MKIAEQPALGDPPRESGWIRTFFNAVHRELFDLRNAFNKGLELNPRSYAADVTAGVENLIIVDASGAARTVNLPPSGGVVGKVYIVLKSDSSANNVTIDPSGSETINGAATEAIATQYGVVRVCADGSNWFKI